MTSGSLNYEFKEIGSLQLTFGKFISDDPATKNETDQESFSYWMNAEFEAHETGASYSKKFDDGEIRKLCTILRSNPELIEDFLVTEPTIKFLSTSILAEFSLTVGSKLYKFTAQIPKFSSEGSLAEIGELHQKNKMLVRRIKTLEDRMKQQEKNIDILTNICIKTICNFDGLDDYLQHCLETTTDISHYVDTFIGIIKDHNDKNGQTLLQMIKNNKLPDLKEALIEKCGELYLHFINGAYKMDNYRHYYSEEKCSVFNDRLMDRLLEFCQIGIETNDIVEHEHKDINSKDKKIKKSFLQYFNEKR